jgi:hypothetical protein
MFCAALHIDMGIRRSASRDPRFPGFAMMKSWIKSIVLVAGVLLTGSALHAQAAWPPGMEPYGAGICGYSHHQHPHRYHLATRIVGESWQPTGC